MSTPLGPIYTAYLTVPTATPDVVRTEIRNAVHEGRAPVPLRIAVTDPNVMGDRIGAGLPIPLGTMPVGTAPQTTTSPFIPLLTPYTPSSVAPAPTPPPAYLPSTPLASRAGLMRSVLIGGAALAGGAAIAYFIFR